MGVGRKLRGADDLREQEQTLVKIPEQTKAYVSTFDKIDKKNLIDSRFDLKGISKKHNFSPKIVKRYYNMHGGNASLYYKRACQLFTLE